MITEEETAREEAARKEAAKKAAKIADMTKLLDEKLQEEEPVKNKEVEVTYADSEKISKALGKLNLSKIGSTVPCPLAMPLCTQGLLVCPGASSRILVLCSIPPT
jgi:hypothetical protein